MVEKSGLIILFMTCITASVLSQNIHYNTSDTFKEGHQLTGKTIEDNGRSLLIFSPLDDTIPFWHRRLLDIKRIEEKSDFRQRQRYHFGEGDFLNVSLALTVAPYIGPASHLHISAGRRIKNKLSVGVGAGLESYRSGIAYVRYSYLSLFTQVRAYLYKKSLKRTRPFISAKLGYGFAENTFIRWHTQEGSYRGGPMFNPSVGLHFSSKRKTKILIAWTYKFQWSTADYVTQVWWLPQQVISVRENNLFARSGLNLIIERW